MKFLLVTLTLFVCSIHADVTGSGFLYHVDTPNRQLQAGNSDCTGALSDTVIIENGMAASKEESDDGTVYINLETYWSNDWVTLCAQDVTDGLVEYRLDMLGG